MKNMQVKKIKVKVEDMRTGEVVKSIDCGTDQRRADKIESVLLIQTNLDKYHVYQSYECQEAIQCAD